MTRKWLGLIASVIILLCVAVWMIWANLLPHTQPTKRVAPGVPNKLKKQITQPINAPMTSYDWILTPAGVQRTLGNFPMGAAISSDHHYMVVTNDGVGIQSVQLVDLRLEKVIQTIDYHPPQALYFGVAFNPNGKQVYASAGGNNVIRVYDLIGDSLLEKAPIYLPSTRKHNFYPAGMEVSPDGRYLYVANNLDNSVSKIDLRTHHIVATAAVGDKPYTVLLSQDGKHLYVSNWGESTVSVLDPRTMRGMKKIDVGLHPNAMALNPTNGTIYVCDSDSDAVSAIDPQTQTSSDIYSLLPNHNPLTGTQPDALTVSADGKTLYVANAGNNDIAVLDLAQAKVTGLIPTAWYPTGVFLLNEKNRLLVLNAKGMGSGPNSVPNTDPQYVGNMMRGTMSFVDVPNPLQLQHYTEQVQQNNQPISNRLATIPRLISTKSPIKHIIYVIRENRTYDQVLGDVKKGNGEPNLVMFGNQITPNAHRLAAQFVLLDNFYADAEVSAQGHNWAVGAKANDYVEKNWEANYSNRNRPSDFEGNDEATYPLNGFLWNAATRDNVTFRDYGEFYKFGTSIPNDPTIGNRYDPHFMGWNLRYSDVDRYKEWAREYKQFEQNGSLPQLEVVRLPNDHTAGTRPGFWTPQSMVSQNDYALGLLVDTVTHSPDWKDTAIFITEDDAQAGVDHVDSHRTVTLVVSPYTQTRKVDSTFYDTTSILHTMELILGMKPLTQYDAAATPMLNAFTDKPNMATYTAVKPIQALNLINSRTAPMSRSSMTLDFSEEDKADENTLNHILWKAAKGNQPYPQLSKK